jgi:hypothetical protein
MTYEPKWVTATKIFEIEENETMTSDIYEKFQWYFTRVGRVELVNAKNI